MVKRDRAAASIRSCRDSISLFGPAFSRIVAVALLAATATPLPAPQPKGTIATAACCNVVELRQYTLRPGRREPFIELFDGTFADPLDATGMTVIGQFRDLDRPNRFVWMRGFQDMTSRAQELAAFYDSDLWHAHRNEANASIDDSDNVLLLEPASAALRFKEVPPRPAAGDPAARVGLVVATLYYIKTDSTSAFTALFERSLRRRAEAAGARTLAAYVTSTQENNFPRLPLRVGEHIFVWVTQFANANAYAVYLEKLTADKKWTATLWPAAREQLTRDSEVLRLTPTPRSRLRG
jgi:NIPSNAP